MADLQVGDCLQVSGPADRPMAVKVQCGSPTSNFAVATVLGGGAEHCPTDVDSSFSQRSSFAGSAQTVCLDIDWVLAGCMSIDPNNHTDPVRADCADISVPNRQRATQILRDVAAVDQCVSGLGYAYAERRFTVCVENVA